MSSKPPLYKAVFNEPNVVKRAKLMSRISDHVSIHADVCNHLINVYANEREIVLVFDDRTTALTFKLSVS